MEEEKKTISKKLEHPVFVALVTSILSSFALIVAAYIQSDATLKSTELSLSAIRHDGKENATARSSNDAQETHLDGAQASKITGESDKRKLSVVESINDTYKTPDLGSPSNDTSSGFISREGVGNRSASLEPEVDAGVDSVPEQSQTRLPFSKFSEGVELQVAPAIEQKKEPSGSTAVTDVERTLYSPTKWEGTVSWKTGKYWWKFFMDNTFSESDGYHGVWRIDGGEIIIMYPGGTVYKGHFSSRRIVGVRYDKRGVASGTFSLDVIN